MGSGGAGAGLPPPALRSEVGLNLGRGGGHGAACALQIAASAFEGFATGGRQHGQQRDQDHRFGQQRFGKQGHWVIFHV